MSDKLAKLLLQLQEDETTYFVLKGRELYTEDNLEVLSNDKNSTKISIIMPETINGQSLDTNLKFYIDFLDGNNKPGVISSQNEIVKVTSENPETDSTEIIEYKITEGSSGDYKTYTISKNEEDITTITLYNDDTIKTSNGIVISQNEINIDGTTYYLQYNTRVSGYRSYTSKVKNENYEDSAEVSDDFPSAYADSTYYLRQSKNIVVAGIHSDTNVEDNLISYSLLEWTLDPSVTEAVGEVTFSIRIEDPTKDWKWQSETAHFTVKSNLQEIYGLRKEIEENFVIQNREIVPVGDFKAVLVKGDTNSNKLFYKMNRYFQGQDMLARKTWTADLSQTEKDIKFNLYKTRDKKKDIIYYLKRDNGDFYIANFKYIINTLTLTDNQNAYIFNNGVIKDCITLNLGTKEDNITFKIDLTNISLYKKYNANKNYYEYEITAIPIFKNNNQYVDIKNKPIYQDIKDSKWYYVDSKELVPTDSLPTIAFDNIKQLNNVLTYSLPYYEYNNGNFTTKSEYKGSFNGIWQVTASDYDIYSDDQGAIKLDTAPIGIVPIFNRLIRFVFLSPNKDYGDWNNAEIEYINEAENYFIFSWTPNARATRTEGELSYTIEFFINAFEEVLDENQNRVINQTKAYSWSTLPSTIKVENNSAATASVNYIPNWVAFVENELAPKIDEFIHNDLESRYDTFENEMKARVFEGYTTYKSNQLISNNITNGYYIEVNGERYELTVTVDIVNNNPISITFTNSQISTIGEKSRTFTLIPVQNSDILYQSVNCILPSFKDDLTNYFLIYNSFTKQTLVFSINDSENTPFFPYLETRLEELITSTKQKIYDNEEDFTTLASNYNIKIDNSTTIESIFNIILSQIIDKIFYNGKEDLDNLGTGEESLLGQFITKANSLTNDLQNYYYGDYKEGLLSYRFENNTITNYNGLINSGKLILNVDNDTNKTAYKIINNGLSGEVLLGYYDMQANIEDQEVIDSIKVKTTLQSNKSNNTETAASYSNYNTEVEYTEKNSQNPKSFKISVDNWNTTDITLKLNNSNYCFGEENYNTKTIPIDLNTICYINPKDDKKSYGYYSIIVNKNSNDKFVITVTQNSKTSSKVQVSETKEITTELDGLSFIFNFENNKFTLDVKLKGYTNSLNKTLLLNDSKIFKIENYNTNEGKWSGKDILNPLEDFNIYEVDLTDLSNLAIQVPLKINFYPFAYTASYTPVKDYLLSETDKYFKIINKHTLTKDNKLTGTTTNIIFKIASLTDVMSQNSQDIESRLMTLLYGDKNPEVGTSISTNRNINYTPNKDNNGSNLMDTCYNTLSTELEETINEKDADLRISLGYFIGTDSTTPEAYENLSSSLESLINTISEEDTTQSNELYETYQNALASLPDFSFEQVDNETALIITFRNTETSSE